MVVTFCGHSMLGPGQTEYLEKKLDEIIEGLILEGAKEFLLGARGEFDSLCALAVKRAKKKHPEIVSVCVLSYLNEKYNTAIYDTSVYPEIESVPKLFAIIKRNEEMVKMSQVVVSHIDHTFGGAYKTYLFAKRKKKRIIEV